MFAIFTTSLIGLSLLLLILTMLPFLKIPHGLIRAPAFLRLQFVALALILTLISWFTLSDGILTFTLCCLIGSIAINSAFIVKFTALWAKQSKTADSALTSDTDRHLRLLTANVKMSNRDYDKLINLVRDEKPDVFAAIETDQAWIDALSVLDDQFVHRHNVPLDTGYGLMLASRLPLSDVQIRDLVTDGVPSIKATVTLPSGDPVSLYIIHPEPPVADEYTTARDSEIALAGLEAVDGDHPVIIAGDLNDIAWSHATRRFQRITGLLDPRVGRGFYNTFNAFYPIFRWPLDHLFHDARFRFVAMQRCRKINSDHFPMSFTLALAAHSDGAAPAPNAGETREVKNMIEQEKKRDRDPVGTDWESDS